MFGFCKSEGIEKSSDKLSSKVVILYDILPILSSNSENTLALSQKRSKFFTKTDALNLLKIIEFIFAVPPTNAFVEHIFSVMKKTYGPMKEIDLV